MCCSTLNQSALRCTSSFSCKSPAARPNNVEQWKCQSGSFMTDVPQSRGRRAVRVQLILAALLAWVAGSGWEFDSNSVLWLYFWDNWSLSAPRDSSHLASIRSGPIRNGCCCMFKSNYSPFQFLRFSCSSEKNTFCQQLSRASQVNLHFWFRANTWSSRRLSYSHGPNRHSLHLSNFFFVKFKVISF